MPRNGVQYVQNDEPSFIRQFKQRIGHKEDPDINAKRQVPNFEETSDSDEEKQEREDEKPVVVVLKPEHLTAEEAEAEQVHIDQGPARLDEKIKFKKPVKRSQDPTEKHEEEAKKAKEENKKSKKDKKPAKPKHNSSLLSFGDEEEEEG